LKKRSAGENHHRASAMVATAHHDSTLRLSAALIEVNNTTVTGGIG
jgi:hypothetical protein